MMKNLDVIAQEQRAQEDIEKLEQEVFTGDVPDSFTGEPLPQPGEEDNDRMFSKTEVQQLVAAAVARERVNVECREYLLSHYFGMGHVTEDIDRVLRILTPKSVDDLVAKMDEVEAEDDVGTAFTRTTPAPRSLTTSLRQIFVRN